MLDYYEAHAYMVSQGENFVIETYTDSVLVILEDRNPSMIVASELDPYLLTQKKLEVEFFAGSYDFCNNVADSVTIKMQPQHHEYIKDIIIKKAEKLLERNYDEYIKNQEQELKTKAMREFAKKGM